VLSQERLKELLSYDSETGIFTWRAPLSKRVRIGAVAGSRMSNGYQNIGVDGRRWLAHHLAWLYVHGEVPSEIDHANRVRNDNRIANLRPCDRSSNAHNLTKPSHGMTSKHKGVHWAKERELWTTQICLNKKRTFVGRYTDEDAAGAAYDWNAFQMFGEFAKLNGDVFVI
jgi:hypothetical protein